jgi:hypothetical protein
MERLRDRRKPPRHGDSGLLGYETTCCTAVASWCGGSCCGLAARTARKIKAVAVLRLRAGHPRERRKEKSTFPVPQLSSWSPVRAYSIRAASTCRANLASCRVQSSLVAWRSPCEPPLPLGLLKPGGMLGGCAPAFGALGEPGDPGPA